MKRDVQEHVHMVQKDIKELVQDENVQGFRYQVLNRQNFVFILFDLVLFFMDKYDQFHYI